MSNKLLYIILCLNLIIYSIVIFVYPHFISDDYLIFAQIKQNPAQIISLNPNEPFFIFFRPVSYFTFWLDFNLFNIYAPAMKFVSLLFHLGLIFVFYKIIQDITLLLRKKNNFMLLFFCMLLLSIHLDALTWIYWISDRTELLGLFFYACSISCLFKYFLSSKNYYLILLIVFYCFSILSKQQGLHLPILVVFIYLLLKIKIKTALTKELLYALIFMLAVMFFYSILNYALYSSDIKVAENFYKKPFSLAGNILNTLVPFLSWKIYNFFILDKYTALVVGILITAMILFFIRKKKLGLYKAGFFLLFILIISYPRIFAIGNQRINGIYLFWLIVGIYFLFLNRFNLYTKIFLLFTVLFYSYSFINRIQNDLTILKKNYNEITELKEIMDQNSGQHIKILAAENSSIIPYKLFFYKYHEFGCDTTLKILPVYFDRSLIYYDEEKYDEEIVGVTHKKNLFCINSKYNLLYLSVDEDNTLLKDITIVKKEKGLSGREYESICFVYNDLEKSKFLYHNGKKWITL